MSKYIVIVFWVLALVYTMPRLNLLRPEKVCGQTELRYPWLVAFLVFIPVIWMAGNRGWFSDTGLYINRYRDMPEHLAGLPGYVSSLNKDPGFYTLSAILRIILGYDYLPYLIVIAALQGIAVVTFFRKYSSRYFISIFLFVVSTDYISWMFNGIRQFMAVAIIILATPFILKKQYIPVILCIILASTMHRSALIMIPIVFIVTGEAWNKKTLLFITAVLIIVLYVGQFTSLLDDVLQNTQYENVVSDYTRWKDDGTHPLKVLVYSVPVILSFLGREQIRRKDNLLINVCANMSIITAGLYLISMVTSGIYLGRLPIYTSLYSYILLPWEIDNLFDSNTRGFTYGFMIAGYILYYYYQMHLFWGMF